MRTFLLILSAMALALAATTATWLRPSDQVFEQAQATVVRVLPEQTSMVDKRPTGRSLVEVRYRANDTHDYLEKAEPPTQNPPSVGAKITVYYPQHRPDRPALQHREAPRVPAIAPVAMLLTGVALFIASVRAKGRH